MTDPIVAAARFLISQLEWVRHATDEQGGPYAEGVLAEIADCAARIRYVVDGPSAKKYLGPCGAVQPVGCDPSCTAICRASCDQATCEGDVYGPAGGTKGTCRTCGAQVAQDERRAWLDEQVVERLVDTPIRAQLIAHAIRISADTIRTWSHTVYAENGDVRRPAKLSSYWWDGERYVPWVEPREGEDVKARGPRLHYVADVMELECQAAARRAENEAKRDRRAGQRESEDAA